MSKAQDTDAQIRERLLAALEDDARTAEAPIEVVSEQGTVTLKGTVDSQKVRQAAKEIAAAQSDVVKVIDDLAVTETDDELVQAPEVAVFDSRAPYIPDLDKEKEE